METWTEAAQREEMFRGKRLSEIASMALSNYVIMTDAERVAATRALALGWLDITENAKNHYGQQNIDRKGASS